MHINNKLKRYSLKFIPLFVTILLFFILFSKINLLDTVRTLTKAKLFPILLAIFLSFISNIFLSVHRWQLSLKILKCYLPLKEVLFISLGSYPLRFILPLRSGELIKAIYLKRKRVLSFRNAVGSIIFDGALASIALLFFLFFGLILNKSLFGITFFFFLFIFLPLFFLRIKRFRYFVYNILKKINKNFYVIIRDFVIIFEKAPLKKTIILILYAVLIEGIVLVEYYLLFNSLNVAMSLSTMLLFIPLVILISLIPVTISGIGVRESLILLFFSSYTSQEVLLSIGLLISFVNYIIPTMLGLFFLRAFLRRILRT